MIKRQRPQLRRTSYRLRFWNRFNYTQQDLLDPVAQDFIPLAVLKPDLYVTARGSISLVAQDFIPLAVLKLANLNTVAAPKVAQDFIPLAVLKHPQFSRLIGFCLRVAQDFIPLAVLKR